MNKEFDVNLFYLFLSDAVTVFPNLVSFFNALYETQKHRFYERARNNPIYNDSLMSNGTLDVEVAMKRTFGILLCSNDDPKLKNAICNAFFKEIPLMEALSKKFSLADMAKSFQMYRCKNSQFEDSLASNQSPWGSD